MSPLQQRAKAAQACIDRFAGKPYDPTSKRDCIQMARHCLHHLGCKVGKVPAYKTEAAGYRALRKLGHGSLVDAMDATGLPRIAPASALAGDILALPSDEEAFGAALCVAVGNGRALGFMGGVCVVMQPKAYLAAWRSI